jgi:ABC-type polar amino acid transport system ATPase subunit
MADAPQMEPPKPIERPRASISSVTFSDGTTLQFDAHEVIVFVGPNNAGKSAALREIFNGLNNRAVGQVATSVNLTIQRDREAIANWVRSFGWLQRNSNDNYNLGFGTFPLSRIEGEWQAAASNGLRLMTRAVAVLVSTEERLGAANPANNANFVEQRPTSPLQILHEDEDLEAKLSALFKKAFGSDLIVNRGAGATITLHFGKRPTPPEGKDRIALEYRREVNALPLVSNQGDGMRSFVGVMLNAFVVDRDIIIIDEPDAFLHPPQATLLGTMLAEETREPRQLVVATHNSDFLKGVLAAAGAPTRVIRIQRDGNINKIKELNPTTVREVWKDPLLRYSNVLDGLFHKGAIVCESDSDCRFYGAMIDVVSKGNEAADLLLVQGAGKSRLATIIRALRAIGVPVRAVTDFDIFAEESTLRTTFEALGGNWEHIKNDWLITKNNIESRRPELPTDDATKEINSVLSEIKTKVFPADSAAKIRETLRRTSAWSEAKRIGRAFLPSGEATTTYQQLAAALQAVGLFVVEVGELEQYCKSVGGHGPAWVNKALERKLDTDPELSDARAFAKTLLDGWQHVG